MVEAAERADAAKSGAKEAISPLHAVGHLGTGQCVMWDSCIDEADEAKSGAKEAISPLHAAGFCRHWRILTCGASSAVRLTQRRPSLCCTRCVLSPSLSDACACHFVLLYTLRAWSPCRGPKAGWQRRGTLLLITLVISTAEFVSPVAHEFCRSNATGAVAAHSAGRGAQHQGPAVLHRQGRLRAGQQVQVGAVRHAAAEPRQCVPLPLSRRRGTSSVPCVDLRGGRVTAIEGVRPVSHIAFSAARLTHSNRLYTQASESTTAVCRFTSWPIVAGTPPPRGGVRVHTCNHGLHTPPVPPTPHAAYPHTAKPWRRRAVQPGALPAHLPVRLLLLPQGRRLRLPVAGPQVQKPPRLPPLRVRASDIICHRYPGVYACSFAAAGHCCVHRVFA